MRSWERKDITDILIKHHEELRETSLKLSGGGLGRIEPMTRATRIDKLDDDCIVIESFLEDTFGIEWDGLKFLGKKVDK